jgi:UV DNA damage endonuclease
MIRLGLCCLFVEEPITFKTLTATYALKLQEERFSYLSSIILHNVNSLQKALFYCQKHAIGSFRISSRFFPLFSHPTLAYALKDLPDYLLIKEGLTECKKFAKTHQIRLTTHPDQFTLLNSPNQDVHKRSLMDLEYHLLLCDLIGADVINIHGGGSYGSKENALKRLEKNLQKLSPSLRKKLTLENDDKSFSPSDLLPICERTLIPFVYDVHHHRCHKDSLSEEEATLLSLKTWDREPLFHLSSPKWGWKSKNICPHADYIDIQDFPSFWLNLPQTITVEIEAKAKEKALEKLQKDLTKKILPC